MIGNRIKQARKASGLSLRALAEKADISAMAISKYENNQSTPSSGVLLSLSKAMNVRSEYFFRLEDIQLKNVEFRKHHKLPKKVQDRIEGNVIEQLERFFELERFLPSRPIEEFSVPNAIPKKIASYSAIEDVVLILRDKWSLGVNPIAELTDMLEERGIKVFQSDVIHDGKFDGLAVNVNGIPIIVVGKDWPGDRQRFTLSHELGHLILKGRLDPQLDDEIAANRFAGAFLATKPEVIKELGEKRTWIEPKELYVLKHAYGLSMNAWLYRAKDLGIISQVNFQNMMRFFNKQGWRKMEPGERIKPEKSQLFEQLVFRALAEELIGESKAAELMGLPIVIFREIRRNMDCGKDVSHQ